MRAETHSPSEAGFTLVEMLVALVIFALLAAASSSVLSVTLNSRAAVAATSETVRHLQVARALMKADLAQMIARPARDAFGSPAEIAMEGGTALRNDPDILIRFARTGWLNPGGRAGRGNIQHVTYRLVEGSLVRETRLRTDPGPDTPVARRVLFTGLETASVRFFDGIAWSNDWVTADFEESNLPRAVEFTLRLEGGDTIPHLFMVKGAAP